MIYYLLHTSENKEISGVLNPDDTTCRLTTDTAGLPFPPETMGQLPLYQHVHMWMCVSFVCVCVCVCVCVPVARVPDGPQMGTQAGSSCLFGFDMWASSQPAPGHCTTPFPSSTLLPHPDSPWITCRTLPLSPQSNQLLPRLYGQIPLRNTECGRQLLS